MQVDVVGNTFVVTGEVVLVVKGLVIDVVTLVVVNEVTGVLHDIGMNVDDEIDVFGPNAVVDTYK